MKWIFENFQGRQVWYSSDVIDKIKQLASPHCSECKKILDVIKKEDMSRD